MAVTNLNYKHKSKNYKNVYLYAKNGEELWLATLGKKQKFFKTEKQAGRFIDLKLIEQGKEPINILVRK